MNIDVFLEAQSLYERYRMCEEVMRYLSDPDVTKGMKYKECLARFVEAFCNDFMMFVQNKMEETGMAFEDLTDCKCAQIPEIPSNPEDPVEPENPDENGGTVDPNEEE